ncbi:hypothetical protein [Desulfonema magnum]|uniref:Uncharacterized protein n=1 Tax=Desulfonema magnum TaxID=45655 RepID=A0A975BP61_9BACT|nr:hypothetical protein [Desulfonema magnum]QTA89076.1 Uncharacterized protein dnm_051240 [Desulfonema magnum]
MYIARDKKTKTILHIDPAPLSENLEGTQVYSGFDPETMEILKSDLSYMPDYYNVDENGFVVEKTDEEKILDGDIGFGEFFQFEGTGDDTDTDTDDFDKVRFVLDNNLVKTEEQCKAIFKYLDDKFEYEVAQKYPAGLETKIIKGLVEWLYEDKPRDDKREKKYLQMKADIEALKEEYKPVRAELKKIVGNVKSELK